MKKSLIIMSGFIGLFHLLFLSCSFAPPEEKKETGTVQTVVTRNLEGEADQVIMDGITIDDLAYHWAPIHYQDVFSVDGDRSRVDYITRVDRDNQGNEGTEWNLENNYDRELRYKLRAHVYYSVVSTTSHYYITYSFFHPWDTVVVWQPDFSIEKIPVNIPISSIFTSSIASALDIVNFPDSISFNLPVPTFRFKKERGSDLNKKGQLDHEYTKNDMEGVLFVVKKDAAYGSLEAVFSQAHGYILTYLTPEGKSRLNSRPERTRPFTIEAQADKSAMDSMNDDVKRIITTQEAQGHGAGCYPDWGAPSPGNILFPFAADKRHNNGNFLERFIEQESGNDHIRYIPTRTGEPEEPDYEQIRQNGYTYCKYKLINVFDPKDGLWANRKQANVFEGGNYKFKGGHGDPFWNWYGSKEGLDPSQTIKDIVHGTIAKIKNKAIELITDGLIDHMRDGVAADALSIVKQWLQDKINALEDKLGPLQDAWNKLKAGLDKLQDQWNRLRDTISGLNNKIADKILDIDGVQKAVDKVNQAIDKVDNAIDNLKDKLKGIPKKIKKWFSWFWKWVTNSSWEDVNNQINQQEKNKVDLSIKKHALTMEKNGLSLQKKILDNELTENQNQLGLLNQDIQQHNRSIQDIGGQITETKNMLKALYHLLENISDALHVSALKDFLIRMEMSVIDNTINLMKSPIEKTVKKWIEITSMHYSPMKLSAEEEMLVNKAHHAWSHNPAHLCWVYLSALNSTDTKSYFTDTYEINQFAEDTLGGNFTYVNNVPVMNQP